MSEAGLCDRAGMGVVVVVVVGVGVEGLVDNRRYRIYSIKRDKLNHPHHTNHLYCMSFTSL